MADCAPPFARPAFRDTFSRFFLFLFVWFASSEAGAGVASGAATADTVTVTSGAMRIASAVAACNGALGYPGLPRAVVAGGRFTFGG